jgi:apolipoprotein N-acyltransferase
MGLAAVLALYYAAICGAFVATGGCVNAAWRSYHWRLQHSGCMAEMARGIWLTGFGWGASGYAHVDGLLAGWMRRGSVPMGCAP